ncbi:MAG: BON domain-containing protein [Acidobacteriota bacterium]
MYPDREVEQRHVVVNTPGERRETYTEIAKDEPRETGLSTSTILLIALVALVVVGLTFYIVSNRNANEEANRQALLEASKTQPQQSVPVQQPLIIQQPVAAPQPQQPVIIQQPAVTQERTSPLDDTTIQDAATKRLTDDPALSTVSIMVISGRATLMGTVNSAELKASAERVVRSVQGVKSVENKIEVSER